MAATDASRAPKDFADLYNDLVNRIREQTGVTSTNQQAQRYINIALLDMHVGTEYKLPWAESSAVLRTKSKYTTGTIAVTKGSTTVTGSSSLWNTANDFSENNVIAGGKITLNATDEVYEVDAIASDTSLTLTTKYIGDTVASDGSYVYFEDDYALDASFLRFVDTRSFNPERNIPIVSRTDFRRMYPSNDLTGYPEVATIVNKDFSGSATPVRKVRLHRAPDKEYLIPYDFITNKLAVSAAGVRQESLSADTDEPIVPYRYRHAITAFALYIWYRDKKDDMARAKSAQSDYVDIMIRMTSDQEVGSPRPKIRPIRSPYVSRANRPYSGSGSRNISSDGFDQLRDR
jgi:hypothetical protein